MYISWNTEYISDDHLGLLWRVKYLSLPQWVCVCGWVGGWVFVAGTRKLVERKKKWKGRPWLWTITFQGIRSSSYPLSSVFWCFHTHTSVGARLGCLEIMCVYLTFIRGAAEIVQWTRGNRKITIHINFYSATPSPPMSLLRWGYNTSIF